MRELMLIIHIISVALFLGAAFSGYIINLVAKKKEDEGLLNIYTALLSLNYLGKTGLTLLIITGGYLMTPYWQALGAMPILIAKLALVIVLLILLVVISIKAKQARHNPSVTNFMKLKPFQNISLVVSIVVVILAVMVFG